jgi:hypothetical protein
VSFDGARVEFRMPELTELHHLCFWLYIFSILGNILILGIRR